MQTPLFLEFHLYYNITARFLKKKTFNAYATFKLLNPSTIFDNTKISGVRCVTWSFYIQLLHRKIGVEVFIIINKFLKALLSL